MNKNQPNPFHKVESGSSNIREHHKIEPNSSNTNQTPFHHEIKPGSFAEPAQPNIKPQGKTLRSLLPPEMIALLPPGSPACDYVLTPAEELTLKRMKEETFDDEMLHILDEDMLSDLEGEPAQNKPKLSLRVPLLPEHSRAKLKSAEQKVENQCLEAARDRIAKRKAKLRQDLNIRQHGPQGEKKSAAITQKLIPLSLDQIVAESDFGNIRLDATSEEMSRLIESMRYEGLKVPITVIAAPGEDNLYYIRSGFRRVEAALELKWQVIPAIILPEDTPEEDEYWTNIIENSARQALHTYEIAEAAKTMRDKFGTSAKDFALKAGYAENYISNLLRAIDRLPDLILERWKKKDKIPVEFYIAWSSMLPQEAINSFNVNAGLHPHLIERLDALPSKDASPPIQSGPQPKLLIKIATSYGYKRMHRLRSAFEGAPSLDDSTKQLCIRTIDFCLGAVNVVPGVYDNRTAAHRAIPPKRNTVPGK